MADHLKKADHLKPYAFQKGMEKRGGRQKGVRNRIAHKFLEDLQRQWEESGPAVLKIMAHEQPGDFAKLVGALLPRELENEFPSQITIVTGVVRHGEVAPITAQIPAAVPQGGPGEE
jgi:hypothetical protein